MNLRRRILLGSLGTVAIMGTIALLAMLLLRSMHVSVLTVIEEYGELREIDEARSHLEDARLALTEHPPRLDDARKALTQAQAVIVSFVNIKHIHVHSDDEQLTEETDDGRSMASQIDRIITTVSVKGVPSSAELAEIRAQIDQLRDQVLTLAGTADNLVDDSLVETQHRTHVATVTLVSLCLAGALFVWTLAFLQYRWVLLPIVTLRDRVRDAVAARRIDAVASDTVDPVGDLGRGFNGMLDELNNLYATLDTRVRQKSQELVMAERLASVGYLAAGVAHEINNPLNAILGYTELTLRDFERLGENASPVTDTLKVVRDETLRCKHIVEKLLSLVRNPDAPREAVEVEPMVNDVVAIIHGLKKFRDCRIETHFPASASPLYIMARDAEIKQVLLNLMINAIEASPDHAGFVNVSAELDQATQSVRIHVTDNGHGMDETTRRRVFEPFFTRKNGQSRSGTGLGLSVAHAIVQDHGGQITAHSDGPGTGSRFTITLHAAEHAAAETPSHA